MAVVLYPAGAPNSPAVTDAQHRDIISGLPDGVTRAQPGNISQVNAMVASCNGTTYSVQPGRMRIQGVVMELTAAIVNQNLAPPSGQTRYDACVAYIDRTTVPISGGIAIRQGTPGSGNYPALRQEWDGRWEVALAYFQVSTSGAVYYDGHRPRIPRGLTVESAASTDLGAMSMDPNSSTLTIGDANGNAALVYYQTPETYIAPYGSSQWNILDNIFLRRTNNMAYMQGTIVKVNGALAAQTDQTCEPHIPAPFQPRTFRVGRACYGSAGVCLPKIATDGTFTIRCNGVIGNGDTVSLSTQWEI